MKATRNYYDIDWKEVFYYDETSPSCLRWKVNVRSGKDFTLLNKAKDSVAGYAKVHKDGRPHSWDVGYKSKLYIVHRIIWCIV